MEGVTGEVGKWTKIEGVTGGGEEEVKGGGGGDRKWGGGSDQM